MTDRPRPALSDVFGLLEAAARGALRAAASRWRGLFEARRLFSWAGLRGFRELPDLLDRLQRDGGIRVVSAAPDGRPVVSTLVTPGGDVVSRVSPEVLSQPALWKRHLETVRQSLTPLQQVLALLRSLSGLLTLGLGGLGAYFALGLVPAADGGFDALLARAVELGGQLKWPIAGGGLVAAARYGLGWWLQARVSTLLA